MHALSADSDTLCVLWLRAVTHMDGWMDGCAAAHAAHAMQAKPVDFARIAQYYESRGEYDKAADMWAKCDKPDKAVQLYLKVRLGGAGRGGGRDVMRAVRWLDAQEGRRARVRACTACGRWMQGCRVACMGWELRRHERWKCLVRWWRPRACTRAGGQRRRAGEGHRRGGARRLQGAGAGRAGAGLRQRGEGRRDAGRVQVRCRPAPAQRARRPKESRSPPTATSGMCACMHVCCVEGRYALRAASLQAWACLGTDGVCCMVHACMPVRGCGCRFKINIATGQYVEAAKDALNLAAFEQSEGNYRVAHDKLFGTVKKLEELGVGGGRLAGPWTHGSGTCLPCAQCPHHAASR